MLASISRFIEDELKLQVNWRKSGVRKAARMTLLGYSFYRGGDGYRLRYCIWIQWKRVRTRYKALRKLGASHRNAYMWANTRKGGWHTAHSYVLKGTITNTRLQKKGYIPLLELYGGAS